MKKRWIAMALAAAMLLSLLTGCGAKQDSQSNESTGGQQTSPDKKTEDFYTLWEEICDIQEAEVDLTRPYHGAVLHLTGTVSRTNHTADLSLALEGAEGQDVEWTQVRIVENDVYLNVGELAESTLSLPLTALRKSELSEFQGTQTAPWMLYQWEGELWEGIPAWKDLLDAFWQDSRAELEPHMKKDGKTGYVLTLEGDALEQDGGKAAQRLLDSHDAYLEGFCEVMDQQTGLRYALPLSNAELFEKLWNRVLRQSGETDTDEIVEVDGNDLAEEPAQDEPEDGFEDVLENVDEVSQEVTEEEEPLTAVSFAIAREEGTCTVSLRHNQESVFELKLTPAENLSAEAPTDVMLFDSYYADIYYLVVLSRNYVEDLLDGVQPEDDYNPELFDDEFEEEPERMPLSTRTAEGYEGVELISFLTGGGTAQSVPILTGWQSNAVTSENDDGVMVTSLTLNEENWEQQVYDLEAESTPEADVSGEIDEYYDLLVNASGYQVAEEPDSLSLSQDGMNAARGFSYQENPYSPVQAKLMVLMRQSDSKTYTVLNFTLDLDNMSDEQRHQLDELFRYLGLEVPIMLKIADIAE